ncbi:phosphotransferase family protein [Actinotalea solisilvae]|uniref:phosphotransferase family protein n=1 Tax=Actinotalea solisilvae TaxID=2072922 RepID=UPI0018F26B73|nr:phosphotransferase [Actinotalea solisilvae]
MDDAATTQDPGSAALRDRVLEEFGVRLVATEEVAHGADRRARLWRARADDGSRYALKRSSGGTPAGTVVSAYLADRGVPGVVGPRRTRHGRLWAGGDGDRLTLVPWVSDTRALDGPMTTAHWRAYGEVLAAVHAAEVTDELAALLPAGGAAYPAVVASARSVDARLRELGPDARADPLVDGLSGVWSGMRDAVTALADAVERLGAGPLADPGPAVVCHGDPHLGNLLLGPRDRVWLVDWDDAVLAPRECDLMFVRDGVLAFAPVTPAQRAAVLAGYGPVDADAARSAWFLALRACDDVADWSRQVLDTGDALAPRRRALDVVRGLASPRGLVTLASAALRSLPGAH